MNETELRALVTECGSKRKAAERLGVNESTVRYWLRKPKFELPAAPEGQVVRGLSTLMDLRTNAPLLQWVKTSTDDIKAEQVRAAVHLGLMDKLPKYVPVVAPEQCNADLMSVYVLTDYHLGMLAWKPETGSEDWDLNISEEMLLNWFSVAITQSPASGRAVFAQLGDFLHWDGLDAVTPQHRHLLDADTRFAKLVRVAIRVIRQIIRMLLEKHGSVLVIMADANHDPASGAWLREWLASVYEDDPRVTVETSADSYYCVEHGLTMNCFHHGHKRGVKDVDRVFAGKFYEVFGRTKFRYAHLGHLHSDEVNETALMRVERHRTLSAPDAYAAKGGWISGRDSKVITYHKQFGEVSRLVINPDMVRSYS